LWAAGVLGASSMLSGLPEPDADVELGVVSFQIPGLKAVPLPRRIVTSGCGGAVLPWAGVDGCPTTSALGSGHAALFTTSDLATASSDLLRANKLFAETGGAHAAGAWIRGSPMVVREDIGRHNAVDKVGGYLVRNKTDGSASMLAVTGRVSSDLILKAAVFRFPVVVSRGAPTDLAVRIAGELEMTLVGFCRGQRMNIYTVPERIAAV